MGIVKDIKRRTKGMGGRGGTVFEEGAVLSGVGGGVAVCG